MDNPHYHDPCNTKYIANKFILVWGKAGDKLLHLILLRFFKNIN